MRRVNGVRTLAAAGLVAGAIAIGACRDTSGPPQPTFEAEPQGEQEGRGGTGTSPEALDEAQRGPGGYPAGGDQAGGANVGDEPFLEEEPGGEERSRENR